MTSRRKRFYDRGRWAVQKERLQISGTPPPPAMQETRVGDLVERVMGSLHLDRQLRRQQLSAEWQDLVGPQVAAHTRPGKLLHGHLTVFVEHSLWLHELSRFGSDAILLKLQQRFGRDKIRRLRLQLDPEGPSGCGR